MKRLLSLFFALAFFIPNFAKADTPLTPNFSVGALQGVAYNSNKYVRSFFSVDDNKLYIANENWALQSSLTFNSTLKDVTSPASTRSVYILTADGKIIEYSTYYKRTLSTTSVPLKDLWGKEVLNNLDKFVGITTIGSYFYVISDHKILELARYRKGLYIKSYWEIPELNFSGVEYNSSEGKFYLTTNANNEMYFISLQNLKTHPSGSLVNSDAFEMYYTPAKNTEGLCLFTDKIIFAESSGELIEENLKELLSAERQAELMPQPINEELVSTPLPEEIHNGIPIGFWGLNSFVSASGLADVSKRFGISIFQVASSAPNYTVKTLLPLVRSAGMQVTLRMTENNTVNTTNGNFDITKWKSQLSLWKNSGVQEFIDDGTLAGHMILDDIANFSYLNGGINPTAEELDEMARYSQEILPGLMTFVREKATRMPVPASGQYHYLDACVNQYTNYPGYSDGPVATYATQQAATAKALGLDVINGLNIADGGDGRSGQLGWGKNHYAMSAEEITTYGEALMNVPGVIMFLMWEYDGTEVWNSGIIGSNYFDKADITDSFLNLSQVADYY